MMSVVSFFVYFGSIRTPPNRFRMSMVRGQVCGPYWMDLPLAVVKLGQLG